MDEIGATARSLHLPAVETVNDRSAFDTLTVQNWRNVCESELKKIITQLSRIQPDPILQSQSKDVESLLILCGENHVLTEWNNAQIVKLADNIFHLVANVLQVQTPAKIFHLERVTTLLFKELKTKVNKDHLKRYPGSVQCFIWAIHFLAVNELEGLATPLLPVCLVLLDDWEIEYQKKGLNCIYHILKEKPKALENSGWYAVIYANLRKCTQLDDRFRVYECLDMCLRNQLPSRLVQTEWNKNDEYDRLIGEIIQSLILDNSSESLSPTLKILHLLIDSMQVKIASHLHLILPSIENRITESVSEEIITLICIVIERIIQYCWPSFEEKTCALLAWILYKLSKHSRQNKAVLETKKSFEIICIRVSPSLTRAILTPS